MSLLADIPFNAPAALPGLLCGVLGLTILLVRRSALAGTALVSVWWWAAASFLLLDAAILAAEATLPEGANSLRRALLFAASMTTFCPLMALLGAKRPQNRAWPWIVLSFWVVLALPAGEWLLFGSAQEIHAARSWFLAVLVAMGAINYLPTRYALAGLLFAAGQIALLAEYLPLGAYARRHPPLIGLSLLLSAMIAAALVGRRSQAREPLDRLWQDFRNLFGTVWALRVAERVNTAAAQSDWGVRLDWSGFRSTDSADERGIPADIRAPLAKNLRSLLLPFVSSQWIAQRLDVPPPQTS